MTVSNSLTGELNDREQVYDRFVLVFGVWFSVFFEKRAKQEASSELGCHRSSSWKMDRRMTGEQAKYAPTGNRTQGKCLEGTYVTTTPQVLVDGNIPLKIYNLSSLFAFIGLLSY